MPHSTRKLTANLPDGRRFVPGGLPGDATVVTCAGPDAHGECPSLMAGHAPACQTATWHVQTDSGQAWSFRFRNSLQACPVTMLTSTPPVVGGTAT